jgi:hypothetical protein
MGNILLHSNALWFVQCYRDISTFYKQGFAPFLGLFLLFIDDFGVYSDRAFHLTKLELIFQCLDGLGMILNPKKTTSGFSKGKMVGHIVSKNGVTTDLEKFDKISKLPFPTTKKAL